MTSADYILISTAIFDSIQETPFSGAVAIVGNKIAAVGNKDEVASQWAGGETKLLDLGDSMILPGLIDSHMHFFCGIFQSSKYMCRDLFECKSEKECVSVIETFAKAHPDYNTITGMGWYPASWETEKMPSKKSLDRIEPNRPVYLMSADGHTFWVNTKALEESKITKDTKVEFGRIGKDETGELNGLLFELEACARSNINAYRLPESEAKELQAEFCRQLSSCGITSVTDMSVLPEPLGEPDEYRWAYDLEQEGRLNVRINLYPSLGTHPDTSIADQLREKYHSPKLRIAGLKNFVDGVTSSYSSLLLDSYIEKPGYHGVSFYPYERYRDAIAHANKNGYGVKLHCTGDGSTRLALNAFEESRKINRDTGVRNSIEHVEILSPTDVHRFSHLDVTATMQPLHLIYASDQLKKRIGENPSKMKYALRSLLECGANLAFSSDYPVVTFDPLPSIYAAVTRSTFDGIPLEEETNEKLTMAQALKAYTYGGAYCVNQESILGTLEPGKLADLIVIDKNLFQIDPKDILNAKVLLTMIDGNIVYKEASKNEKS